MGSWFARFFRKNGYKVQVTSRHTELTPPEVAAWADVIVVAVPLSAVEKVARGIGPRLRRGALAMPITSLQEMPVKAMLKYSKSAVIGCHPMFNPYTNSIQGQTVILCPEKKGRWLGWMKGLFKSNRANIKITTAREHDKEMAVVQALRHFAAISLAGSLKDLKIIPEEILKFCGPIHKIGLYSIGRILTQNPQLYADIQMMNPFTKKVVKEYVKAVGQLERIVLRKDRKKFNSYFKAAADFSDKFKKKSAQESEYLIEKLVQREKGTVM